MKENIFKKIDGHREQATIDAFVNHPSKPAPPTKTLLWTSYFLEFHM